MNYKHQIVAVFGFSIMLAACGSTDPKVKQANDKIATIQATHNADVNLTLDTESLRSQLDQVNADYQRFSSSFGQTGLSSDAAQRYADTLYRLSIKTQQIGDLAIGSRAPSTTINLTAFMDLVKGAKADIAAIQGILKDLSASGTNAGVFQPNLDGSVSNATVDRTLTDAWKDKNSAAKYISGNLDALSFNLDQVASRVSPH